MKANKWPIKPISITNDGEQHNIESGLNCLSGVGIITNDRLKQLLTKIAINFNKPIIGIATKK